MNSALYSAFTKIRSDFSNLCKIEYEMKNGIIHINTLINELVDCSMSVNYFVKAKVRLDNEGSKSRMSLNKFVDLLPKLFVEEAFFGDYGSFSKTEFEVADILIHLKYQST